MKRTLYIVFLLLMRLFLSASGQTVAEVGTPRTGVEVSPTGGACCDIKIDCPRGVQAMQPNISLSYNSQGGIGTAGYGFNVSGFSTITCGLKDLYHDGTVKGIVHKGTDALYLDGKRLLLKSGEAGTEGAAYAVEGDPFTKAACHVENKKIWFSVTTRDGKKYEYREVFGFLKMHGGGWRVGAWYLTRQQDALGNYIDYSYKKDGMTVYLKEVVYGNNVNVASGSTSSVNFEYEKLQNPYFYPFEDHTCFLGLRLKTITTSTGSDIFRTYELQYDSISDQSLARHSRLIRVVERNGGGEQLNPVAIDWKHLPSGEQKRSAVEADLEDYGFIEKQDQNFLSADLNGDGISDIVRLSRVKVYTVNTGSYKQWTWDTYAYVYRSYRKQDGNIGYEEPLRYSLGAQMDLGNMKSIMGGSAVVDIDGDGLNDLLIPYLHTIDKLDSKSVQYGIIFGKDARTASTFGSAARNVASINCPLIATTDMPCYTTGDFNKDGKDEIFYIEDKMSDGKYEARLVGLSGEKNVTHEDHAFSLPSAPKRVFSGDFNNDGLTDIIVFYDGGYTIFYNGGGTDGFFGDATYSDTSFGAAWRMEQGDFNGDGLVDFAYTHEQSWDYYFALNDGNGKFHVVKAWTTYMPDQSTNKDNYRNNLVVYDIDRDGKSDVVILKAQYVHHGGLTAKNVFNYTGICWLRSDGEKLVEYKRVQSPREDDALCGSYMLGDFTGTGATDLMGYGCDWYADGKADNTPQLRLYHTKDADAATGKVCRVVDGMGREARIAYGTMADPDVYTHSFGAQYPLADVHYALPLVKEVRTSNGIADTTATAYAYHGLKVHQTGKGMLGFWKTTVSNTVQKTGTTREVTAWNDTWQVQAATRVTNQSGDAVATTDDAMSVVATGDGNYFFYLRSRTSTDPDGNVTQGEYRYGARGEILSEKETYDSDDSFYRETAYDGYVDKGGQYLPTLITRTQKHKDDSAPYVQSTRIAYDDRGLAVKTEENADTPMALSTVKTFDVWGNVLSSLTTGKGVAAITLHNEYDSTGRFVVKSWQEPAAAVTAFTYDTWGNVLTETDESNPSNPQTVKHGYDGWGTLVSTTFPTGIEKTIRTKWLTDQETYTVTVAEPGKPLVKTTYDNTGRKTGCETRGLGSVPYKYSLRYDSRGNLARKSVLYKNASLHSNFVYDDRNRIVEESHTSKVNIKPNEVRRVSYVYGNRSVTAVDGIRRQTTEHDAWGNVCKLTDSLTTTVYTYNSNGKPAEVACGGSVVSMKYDEAGNRTELNDPDAGLSTYEYGADGKLLRQTDARGIVTENSYDELGRLSASDIGGHTLRYEYGTEGYGLLRLVKTSLDGNVRAYGYDAYGRIVSEHRTLADGTSLDYAYAYNGKNQLTDTTYPGGVGIHYTYDTYGYKNGATCNDASLYKLKVSLGTMSTYYLGDKMQRTTTNDLLGFTHSAYTVLGGDTIQSISNTYDAQTGDLLGRSIDGKSQTFRYDGLDRLISADGNGEKTEMAYADNGNILFKTGIGGYTYNENFKPHAVVGVENADGSIPSSTLTAAYNEYNKISAIEDEGNAMTFVYVPDRQRWKSTLTQDGKEMRSTVYGDEYERVTEDGVTRHFYYVDGMAIVMKEDGGESRVFYPLTDSQGNILKLTDADGNVAFEASYDAWGRQTVKVNAIGFHRGYTGHEMLGEFGIINMNGRLYDPLLGRFLSPDRYVQSPDNSQNFNRYSYCLNNPLKYTDPSGESITLGLVLGAAIVGGIINVATNAISGNIHSVGQAFALFGTGGIAGVATMVSPLVGAATLGFGNSVVNQGFTNGFNNIDWGEVGMSTTISTMTACLGKLVEPYLSPMVEKWTSGISSNLLRITANSSIYNGISGFGLGTVFSLGCGQGFDDALNEGLKDGALGAATGAISGFTTGLMERPVISINADNYQPDPNVIAKSVMASDKMPLGSGTNSVYYGVDKDGVIRYVGITERNPTMRFNEHYNSNTNRNVLYYRRIEGTGELSRIQARIIEQVLINTYGLQRNNGQLFNKINSIAPTYWNSYGIINR